MVAGGRRGGSADAVALGRRIRSARKERGLTSVELADLAGVSQGLISQVENGRSDPSLETLRRLAEALDLPLFDLFQETASHGVAVRRSDARPAVTTPRSEFSYAKLSPPDPVLEVLRGRLRPGAVSSAQEHRHPAHECVLVEQGTLTVQVETEELTLGQGDSCAFDSRRPHRYLNRTDEDVSFLVFATPPSF
ncbi:XRE family transcriptional regulator [Tamaricihabitans halophyticus]|uniref:XRE family transcriptional regulator n=1 Tax=Tamaricihabitans halophyticus TaxID=1262583 RepID=A0A4R2QBR8_9PSEU|nr:XRE family transcriptional regulator [Tamaricihabitans halophyticus]TCP45764.1 XRE family transcriptional regulator [Tamaricihabitans halophyticus]